MSTQAPLQNPIRILQITDFHLLATEEDAMLGLQTQHSLNSLLASLRPLIEATDLFLLTGDLVQEAIPATYKRLRILLEGIGKPCYCLPGNHDDPQMMREYLVSPGKIYVENSLVLAGWHLIFLDSTVYGSPCGHLAEQQLNILKESLASHKDLPTLVLLHHSPIPTGSHWLDTMTVQNAEEFFRILDANAQVKAVVFGHVHQQLKEQRGELRLLACPSTCFQFKPASREFALDLIPPGYRWLHLFTDGSLDTGVVRMEQVPAGLDLHTIGY
jgi:Icc protein